MKKVTTVLTNTAGGGAQFAHINTFCVHKSASNLGNTLFDTEITKKFCRSNISTDFPPVEMIL